MPKKKLPYVRVESFDVEAVEEIAERINALLGTEVADWPDHWRMGIEQISVTRVPYTRKDVDNAMFYAVVVVFKLQLLEG